MILRTAELLNELMEGYTWLLPFCSDSLLQVESVFQVLQQLGDDLIGQLIYELFGAFLDGTHDLIISREAGVGQGLEKLPNSLKDRSLP